jgi:2-keto-4-pentenoate hydratase/2-oxohepta-3-ene-1,7-dioic acid hydratase in catechol pathway
MRLVTFTIGDRPPSVGVATQGGVVPLAEADPRLPERMIDLIAAGPRALDQAREAAARGRPIPMAAVRLLAPVPDPPAYIGVGLNYRDHLNEASAPPPAQPVIFNKQVSCVTGPFDDIVLPRVSEQLDYEGELGLVVRAAGRDLDPVQAAQAIFGYVAANDVSVRDWQLASPTHTVGKSFDTHGPFGPWIVTADELPLPLDLRLRTLVNGKVRQDASTAEMIFDPPAIVGFLSSFMSLRDGMVIATGTPQGVGLFHTPPAFLRAGDLVEVEIEGVGRIANRVAAEAAGARP